MLDNVTFADIRRMKHHQMPLLQDMSINDYSEALNYLTGSQAFKAGQGNMFSNAVKSFSAGYDELLDTYAAPVQHALGTAGEKLFGFFGADQQMGREVGEQALRQTLDFAPMIAGAFTGPPGWAALAASGGLMAANTWEKTGGAPLQTAFSGAMPFMLGPLGKVGGQAAMAATRGTIGKTALGRALGTVGGIELADATAGQMFRVAGSLGDRLIAAAGGEAAMNFGTEIASSIVQGIETGQWTNPFSKENILAELVDPTIFLGIGEILRPSVVSERDMTHAELAHFKAAGLEEEAEKHTIPPAAMPLTPESIEERFDKLSAVLETVTDAEEKESLRIAIEKGREMAYTLLETMGAPAVLDDTPTVFGKPINPWTTAASSPITKKVIDPETGIVSDTPVTTIDATTSLVASGAADRFSDYEHLEVPMAESVEVGVEDVSGVLSGVEPVTETESDSTLRGYVDTATTEVLEAVSKGLSKGIENAEGIPWWAKAYVSTLQKLGLKGAKKLKEVVDGALDARRKDPRHVEKTLKDKGLDDEGIVRLDRMNSTEPDSVQATKQILEDANVVRQQVNAPPVTDDQLKSVVTDNLNAGQNLQTATQNAIQTVKTTTTAAVKSGKADHRTTQQKGVDGDVDKIRADIAAGTSVADGHDGAIKQALELLDKELGKFKGDGKATYMMKSAFIRWVRQVQVGGTYKNDGEAFRAFEKILQQIKAAVPSLKAQGGVQGGRKAKDEFTPEDKVLMEWFTNVTKSKEALDQKAIQVFVKIQVNLPAGKREIIHLVNSFKKWKELQVAGKLTELNKKPITKGDEASELKALERMLTKMVELRKRADEQSKWLKIQKADGSGLNEIYPDLKTAQTQVLRYENKYPDFSFKPRTYKKQKDGSYTYVIQYKPKNTGSDNTAADGVTSVVQQIVALPEDKSTDTQQAVQVNQQAIVDNLRKAAANVIPKTPVRGDGKVHPTKDVRHPDGSSKKVTYTMVIDPEGNVLVLKRGSTAPYRPNAWGMPGGSVDKGEGTFYAALREMQEEIGLTVDEDRVELFSDNPGRNWATYVVFITEAEKAALFPNGQIPIDKKLGFPEHSAFEWVPMHGLAALQLDRSGLDPTHDTFLPTIVESMEKHILGRLNSELMTIGYMLDTLRAKLSKAEPSSSDPVVKKLLSETEQVFMKLLTDPSLNAGEVEILRDQYNTLGHPELTSLLTLDTRMSGQGDINGKDATLDQLTNALPAGQPVLNDVYTNTPPAQTVPVPTKEVMLQAHYKKLLANGLLDAKKGALKASHQALSNVVKNITASSKPLDIARDLVLQYTTMQKDMTPEDTKVLFSVLREMGAKETAAKEGDTIRFDAQLHEGLGMAPGDKATLVKTGWTFNDGFTDMVLMKALVKPETATTASVAKPAAAPVVNKPVSTYKKFDAKNASSDVNEVLNELAKRKDELATLDVKAVKIEVGAITKKLKKKDLQDLLNKLSVKYKAADTNGTLRDLVAMSVKAPASVDKKGKSSLADIADLYANKQLLGEAKDIKMETNRKSAIVQSVAQLGNKGKGIKGKPITLEDFKARIRNLRSHAATVEAVITTSIAQSKPFYGFSEYQNAVGMVLPYNLRNVWMHDPDLAKDPNKYNKAKNPVAEEFAYGMRLLVKELRAKADALETAIANYDPKLDGKGEDIDVKRTYTTPPMVSFGTVHSKKDALNNVTMLKEARQVLDYLDGLSKMLGMDLEFFKKHVDSDLDPSFYIGTDGRMYVDLNALTNDLYNPKKQSQAAASKGGSRLSLKSIFRRSKAEQAKKSGINAVVIPVILEYLRKFHPIQYSQLIDWVKINAKEDYAGLLFVEANRHAITQTVVDYRVQEGEKAPKVDATTTITEKATGSKGGVSNLADAGAFGNSLPPDVVEETHQLNPQPKDAHFTVHQGSGGNHDKMDTAFVQGGKGEGAIVYGWGIYFTDVPSVARNYQDQSQSRHVTKGDTGAGTLLSASGVDHAAGRAIRKLLDLGPISDTYAMLNEFVKDPNLSRDTKIAYDILRSVIRQLDANGSFSTEQTKQDLVNDGFNPKEAIATVLKLLGGESLSVNKIDLSSFYTVDLLATRDELPIWDYKFSEQTDKVKARFRQHGVHDFGFADKTFGEWYKTKAGDNSGRYKEVSKSLIKMGFKGHSYYTGFARTRANRGATITPGDFNHVMYVNDAMSVRERKTRSWLGGTAKSGAATVAVKNAQAAKVIRIVAHDLGLAVDNQVESVYQYLMKLADQSKLYDAGLQISSALTGHFTNVGTSTARDLASHPLNQYLSNNLSLSQLQSLYAVLSMQLVGTSDSGGKSIVPYVNTVSKAVLAREIVELIITNPDFSIGTPPKVPALVATPMHDTFIDSALETIMLETMEKPSFWKTLMSTRWSSLFAAFSAAFKKLKELSKILSFRYSVPLSTIFKSPMSFEKALITAIDEVRGRHNRGETTPTPTPVTPDVKAAMDAATDALSNTPAGASAPADSGMVMSPDGLPMINPKALADMKAKKAQFSAMVSNKPQNQQLFDSVSDALKDAANDVANAVTPKQKMDAAVKAVDAMNNLDQLLKDLTAPAAADADKTRTDNWIKNPVITDVAVTDMSTGRVYKGGRKGMTHADIIQSYGIKLENAVPGFVDSNNEFHSPQSALAIHKKTLGPFGRRLLKNKKELDSSDIVDMKTRSDDMRGSNLGALYKKNNLYTGPDPNTAMRAGEDGEVGAEAFEARIQKEILAALPWDIVLPKFKRIIEISEEQKDPDTLSFKHSRLYDEFQGLKDDIIILFRDRTVNPALKRIATSDLDTYYQTIRHAESTFGTALRGLAWSPRLSDIDAIETFLSLLPENVRGVVEAATKAEAGPMYSGNAFLTRFARVVLGSDRLDLELQNRKDSQVFSNASSWAFNGRKLDTYDFTGKKGAVGPLEFGYSFNGPTPFVGQTFRTDNHTVRIEFLFRNATEAQINAIYKAPNLGGKIETNLEAGTDIAVFSILPREAGYAYYADQTGFPTADETNSDTRQARPDDMAGPGDSAVITDAPKAKLVPTADELFESILVQKGFTPELIKTAKQRGAFKRIWDLLGADGIELAHLMNVNVRGRTSQRQKDVWEVQRRIYLGDEGLGDMSVEQIDETLAIVVAHELAHLVEYAYDLDMEQGTNRLGSAFNREFDKFKQWTETASPEELTLAMEIAAENLPEAFKQSSIAQEQKDSTNIVSTNDPGKRGREVRANLLSLWAFNHVKAPDSLVFNLMPNAVRRIWHKMTDLARSIYGAIKGTTSVIPEYRYRQEIRRRVEHMTDMMTRHASLLKKAEVFEAESRKLINLGDTKSFTDAHSHMAKLDEKQDLMQDETQPEPEKIKRARLARNQARYRDLASMLRSKLQQLERHKQMLTSFREAFSNVYGSVDLNDGNRLAILIKAGQDSISFEAIIEQAPDPYDLFVLIGGASNTLPIPVKKEVVAYDDYDQIFDSITEVLDNMAKDPTSFYGGGVTPNEDVYNDPSTMMNDALDELKAKGDITGYNYKGKFWFHGSRINNEWVRYDENRLADTQMGLHLGTAQQANHFSPGYRPYLVKLKNPLRLHDQGDWAPDKMANELVTRGIRTINYEVALNELKARKPDGVAMIEWLQHYRFRDQRKDLRRAIQADIESAGYDGISYANGVEGAGESIIIFRPEQIKLAQVTKDKEGNIIPLSKRLDSSNERADFWFKKKPEALPGSVVPRDNRGAIKRLFDFIVMPFDQRVQMVPTLQGINSAMHNFNGGVRASMKRLTAKITGGIDSRGLPIFSTDGTSAVDLDGQVIADPVAAKKSALTKLDYERVRDDKHLNKLASDWMRLEQRHKWTNAASEEKRGKLLSYNDLKTAKTSLFNALEALPPKDRNAIVQTVHRLHEAMYQLQFGETERVIDSGNLAVLKAVISSKLPHLWAQAGELAKDVYIGFRQLTSINPADQAAGQAALLRAQTTLDPETYGRVFDMARELLGDKHKLFQQFMENPHFFSEIRVGKYFLRWKNPDGTTDGLGFENLKDAQDYEQMLLSRPASSRPVMLPMDVVRRGTPHMLGEDRIMDLLKSYEEKNRAYIDSLGLTDDMARLLKSMHDYSHMFHTELAASEVLRMGSNRKLTPGASDLDMIQTQFAYFNAAMRALHKKVFYNEVAYELSNPEMKNPQVAAHLPDVMKHIDNFMSPDTQTGTDIATINAAYFLGLNFSSYIVELAQPAFSFIPELQRHNLSYVKSIKLMNRAQAAVAEYTIKNIPSVARRVFKSSSMKSVLSGTGTDEAWTNPDYRDLMKHAVEQDWINLGHAADIVEADLSSNVDLSGVAGRGGGKKEGLAKFGLGPVRNWAKLMLKSYQMFTEHNARVALILGYELGISKGMSKKDAINYAGQFARTVTYSGGKANRPVAMFGGREQFRTVGQAMYSLQGYTFSTLGMMRRYAELAFSKNQYPGLSPNDRAAAKRALFTMIATQFLGAGLVGLPFVAAIIKMYEEITGDELEREMFEGLTELFSHDQQHDGGLLADIVMHGAANAALGKVLPGAPDVGSRFSIGGVLGVNAYDGYSLPALLGPTSSVIEHVAKGATSLLRDRNAGQAFQDVAPVAWKKMIDLMRNDGEIRDRNGGLLINANLGEKIAYGIGFTPQSVKRLKYAENLQTRHEERTRKEEIREFDQIADLFEQDPNAARMLVAQKAQNDPKVQFLMERGMVQEAQSEYLRALKSGVDKVAERIEKRVFARDPRRNGTFKTTLGQEDLIAATMQGGNTSEMQRLQVKAQVQGAFGMPGPSAPQVSRASLVDMVMQQNPNLSRPQAAMLAEQWLLKNPALRQTLGRAGF